MSVSVIASTPSPASATVMAFMTCSPSWRSYRRRVCTWGLLRLRGCTPGTPSATMGASPVRMRPVLDRDASPRCCGSMMRRAPPRARRGVQDERERDAGRARRGIRPAAPRPPPAADGRPRPGRAAPQPRRRWSCSSTSRSSSRSARPVRRPRTCSNSGTGPRRSSGSRSPCSRSAWRGSTTRGSPRLTTTTTSSSASRPWCRCSACSCWRSACRRCSTRSTRASTSTTAWWSPATSSCASPRSRSGCASRSTTRRTVARRSPTRSSSAIIQVGWVATIFVNPPLARHAASSPCSARSSSRPVRRSSTAVGRTPWHASPHRRTLRAARHHHPRRGRARHDPRDLGRGRASRVGRSRPPRGVRRHARSRSACGGCTSPCRRPRCCTRFRERGVRLGLRPLLHLRLARGDGRRSARGGVRDRGRRAHQPGRRRCSRSSCRSRLFLVALFTIYSLLLRQFDPFHIWLFIGSIVALVLAVSARGGRREHGRRHRAHGARRPFVVIVGYETVGHRHQAAALRDDARAG